MQTYRLCRSMLNINRQWISEAKIVKSMRVSVTRIFGKSIRYSGGDVTVNTPHKAKYAAGSSAQYFHEFHEISDRERRHWCQLGITTLTILSMVNFTLERGIWRGLTHNNKGLKCLEFCMIQLRMYFSIIVPCVVSV